MKISIIIAALFILNGCAAPARYEYLKEGASQFQRTDALSECQYQTKLNKTPPLEQQELIHLCMQSKGYRYKKVS